MYKQKSFSGTTTIIVCGNHLTILASISYSSPIGLCLDISFFGRYACFTSMAFIVLYLQCAPIKYPDHTSKI